VTKLVFWFFNIAFVSGWPSRDSKSAPFLSFNSLGSPAPTMPNEPVIVQKNRLNVGQAPAQRGRNDQNYRDHTERSGLFSSRRMLQHFRDLVGLFYSYECSVSEQN
jgi:hypothetical protein